MFQFLYHAENVAEKLHGPNIRLYHGYSNTGIFFWPKILYQKFSMEESVVMMKNPVVAVRSLVFFNECSIIHAPLLTVLGWLFWRNVYIVDNSCYIRTVQQLGSHIVSYHLFSFCKSIQDYVIHMDMEIVILMFHLQKLQIVMDPLDDFVFFVLVWFCVFCFSCAGGFLFFQHQYITIFWDVTSWNVAKI